MLDTWGTPYTTLSLNNEDGEVFTSDPATGLTISLWNACTAIHHYCSALPPSLRPFHPVFRYSASDERGLTSYTCTINLPGTIIDGTSTTCTLSAGHARRRVCFMASKLLLDAGMLDAQSCLHLASNPRHNELSRHALVAIDPILPDQGATGARTYQRQRPRFWTGQTVSGVTRLFPLVVSFPGMTAMHSPMVILTRTRLPQPPCFQIFQTPQPSLVNFTSGQQFTVSAKELSNLYLFTLRVCRIATNRPCSCRSLDDMQYFFAPLASDWISAPTTENAPELDIRRHVLWDQVALAADTWQIPLRFGQYQTVAEDTKDAVILDRSTEFTKRYVVTAIHRNLSPLSKIHDENVRGCF